MRKNRTVKYFLLSLITTSLLVSCSSGLLSRNNSDLQNQVYVLQTQNALLQTQNAQPSNSLEIPAAPDTNSSTEIQIATSTPESLPTSPVPAGQPVTFDGWSVTVSKEIVTDYDAFGVKFIIRNLGESDRIFRYQMAGVTISDDLGNTYQPTEDYLCEENMFTTKNFSIKGGETDNIFSPSGYRNCHEENGLQQFQAPISIDAKQLLVHLEKFGPLDNVTFVIDL